MRWLCLLRMLRLPRLLWVEAVLSTASLCCSCSSNFLPVARPAQARLAFAQPSRSHATHPMPVSQPSPTRFSHPSPSHAQSVGRQPVCYAAFLSASTHNTNIYLAPAGGDRFVLEPVDGFAWQMRLKSVVRTGFTQSGTRGILVFVLQI